MQTVSFFYTGAKRGSFVKQGRATDYRPGIEGKRASESSNGDLSVFAMRQVPHTDEEVLIIHVVPRQGTFPIACAILPGAHCSAVYGYLDDVMEASTIHGAFALTSGTVTVLSLTDDDASGTFSGRGWLDTARGKEPFAIENGSFDVKLVSR
jgi:hypothetical protein